MSINFVGLASNLDTGAIISELMKIERIPYQKLETQKSLLTSKQSKFRTLNTKLRTLEFAAADLLLKSNFSLVKATSSKESAVKITSSSSAAVGTYHIEVEKMARAHVVKSEEFSASGIDLMGTELTLHFNGKTLPVIKSDKTNNAEILEDIKNQINSANVGVRASVIETSPGKKMLVLAAKETGTANGIEWGLDNPVSDTITYFEWSGLNKSDFKDAVPAQDAIFTVNGVKVTGHASNTISGVIEGVTFELLAENDTAVITVERDYNAIAGKVEAFVNAYNDIIQTIRDYTAKGAELQGNSTLRSLSSQLSQWINRDVADGLSDEEKAEYALRFLWQVGLEVDRGILTASDMTGKINFDKNKFIEALKNNEDAVLTLFQQEDEKNPGVIRRFRDLLKQNWTDFMDGGIAKEIAGFDASIAMLNERMERMEYQLSLREEQLKKQWTAMEVALGNLQSQQLWIAAQLTALMTPAR